MCIRDRYYDGTIAEVPRVPQEIRDRYQTAFEIDPKSIIECAARRQKWIDMGQSLNLYMCEPSGKKLHEMYMHAWRTGLKTTYYLRTLAATQVEKSTVDINKFGVQPRWMKSKSASAEIAVNRVDSAQPAVPAPAAAPATDMSNVSACSLDNPDCEACQ